MATVSSCTLDPRWRCQPMAVWSAFIAFDITRSNNPKTLDGAVLCSSSRTVPCRWPALARMTIETERIEAFRWTEAGQGLRLDETPELVERVRVSAGRDAVFDSAHCRRNPQPR
jgi:hypothetical protein